MGIKNATDFLRRLEGKGMLLGLERIQKFLGFIGDPEKSFNSVHIAGSKGKGSTCAFVERILREAGYKTGLYTSPHLLKLNERIRVNGKQISDAMLFGLVAEARKEMLKSGVELTYFEFLTALAFKHFAKSNVDFAVVETGMGGRLDATNVLQPMACAITNIELEHTEHLGLSVEKIAAEKAGIIKKGIPVATAEQKESVLNVFRKKCGKENADLVVVKNPFEGKIGLLGSFQKMNAALAIAIVQELQKQGIKISPAAIRAGLAKAEWPGRMQVLQRNPTVIADCCHTPASAKALACSFKENFPQKKAVLVVGISNDKGLEGISSSLAGISQKAFAAESKTKPMPAEKVAAAFQKKGVAAKIFPSIPEAVKKALSAAGKGDIVLIAGSCFVVGEAMAALKKGF